MPVPAHVADRSKVDRARARDVLRLTAAAPEEPALDATDAEIDAALAEVDQGAAYDEQRARWTVQVWDRKTPINGVPAEHFLGRDDVPDTGDVYLLLRDGQVAGFQPHEPEVEGIVRIPKGQGKVRGEKHADTIAADNTAAEVLARVRTRILANRAGAST